MAECGDRNMLAYLFDRGEADFETLGPADDFRLVADLDKVVEDMVGRDLKPLVALVDLAFDRGNYLFLAEERVGVAALPLAVPRREPRQLGRVRPNEARRSQVMEDERFLLDRQHAAGLGPLPPARHRGGRRFTSIAWH